MKNSTIIQNVYFWVFTALFVQLPLSDTPPPLRARICPSSCWFLLLHLPFSALLRPFARELVFLVDGFSAYTFPSPRCSASPPLRARLCPSTRWFLRPPLPFSALLRLSAPPRANLPFQSLVSPPTPSLLRAAPPLRLSARESALPVVGSSAYTFPSPRCSAPPRENWSFYPLLFMPLLSPAAAPIFTEVNT